MAPQDTDKKDANAPIAEKEKFRADVVGGPEFRSRLHYSEV